VADEMETGICRAPRGREVGASDFSTAATELTIEASSVKVIKWTEKTVKVSALKPFERNHRKISEADYARLKKSLTENGYHQRVLATKDLRVVGGHQRICVLSDLGIKEIAVLVPDKELTDDQFRRILIQDNLPFGSWDFDLLRADFEVECPAFYVPVSVRETGT
jgi:hypothetical protein